MVISLAYNGKILDRLTPRMPSFQIRNAPNICVYRHITGYVDRIHGGILKRVIMNAWKMQEVPPYFRLADNQRLLRD